MTDEGELTPDPHLAWEMIRDIRAGEEHFDNIKGQCRSLASTWLLGAFAAIGFLVSKDVTLGIPVEVVILGVGMAASVGLLLIWMLDLLVYHRLLDAYFIEGARLEQKYSFLPQVRQTMIASQPTGQTAGYEVRFYIVAINAPLVFSGAIFCHWCLRFGPWVATLAGLTIACTIVLIGRRILKKSPNPALQPALSAVAEPPTP
jgi:hypothetical protein